MASQNPTPNMLWMQEEIKRLQQLQRLRAAAAVCNFPNAGGAGGLLSSSASATTNSSSMGLATGNDSSRLITPVNMRMSNNTINSIGMNCTGGANNSALATLLAKQQQETQLMLLQHHLTLNDSNTGTGVSSLQQSQLLGGSLPAGLFSDLNLPTPPTLPQQQQLQLQQQLQQQHELQHQTLQQNELLASRPLIRVGAIEPFPEKLHRMLVEVEQCGRGDIISFINNGRGFAIHKPDTFFKEIVPLYFRHSRLSSFKRQLNLYGFEQINIGPFRGGYYHEQFHRNDPTSCRRMRRVAVKVSGATTQRKKEQEEAARAKAEAEAEKVSRHEGCKPDHLNMKKKLD